MDRAFKTRTESKDMANLKTIVCTYTATMFAVAWTVNLATKVLTTFDTSSQTDAHSFALSTMNLDASR